MNVTEFQDLIKPVTDLISAGAVDSKLNEELNRLYPPGGDTFDAIEKACHQAVAAGWMCAEGEEGGPRWGRVIEPGQETGLAEGLFEAGLRLSFREGGEEFRPQGHAHTRKLKKLLQEEGVVPWMRDCVPLLYAGPQLVAVGDLWLAAAAVGLEEDLGVVDGVARRAERRPHLGEVMRGEHVAALP